MRTILAATSLALLAASGGGGSAVPAPPADPGLVAMRAEALRACTGDVRPGAAPGTDIPRLCGCAVDRLMAGKTAAQLRQTGNADERNALGICAAQLGVPVPAWPHAPADGASAAPVAPADPELVAMRARGIAGCSTEVSRRSPPGTDVARLCGCAVDSLMAGRTAAELRQTRVRDEQRALNACAGEQGVTLTAMPDSAAAPAAPTEAARSTR